MCEINKKSVESMGCECKYKQICSEMQSESLRKAIHSLEQDQGSKNVILTTLKSTYNLIDAYSCFPSKCLLKRIQWVSNNIEDGDSQLFRNEKFYLETLILELKVFLNRDNMDNS